MSRPSLLLVGHGSSQHPESGNAVRAHAAALAEDTRFAHVDIAFLREEPFLQHAVDRIPGDDLRIVPVFTANGHITTTLLPREMGLDGRITARQGRRILLCDAVGSHPSLNLHVISHARSIVAGLPDIAEPLHLILGAHGNPKNPASADRTRAMAARLAETGDFAAVHPLFLEEAPFFKNWRQEIPVNAAVLSLPFLIAGGFHGALDIPRYLGLDPENPKLAALANGIGLVGPFTSDSRTTWCARPIGLEPFITGMIAEQALSMDHLGEQQE
ncbi:MAG: CbiX/SirB N-terminal domain-containing protein [Magnetospiraceae bacterium]